MSDREAILDVIARYAHAVDDRDIDGIVDCFAPDGRIDFEGGARSGERHDGIRAAFEAAFARPELAPPAASTHVMTSTIVTVDGDTATAATLAVANLACPLDGTLTVRGLATTTVSGGWTAGGSSPIGCTAAHGRR